MKKIRTLFLSGQPAVLSASISFFLSNPFLVSDFDDFNDITRKFNGEKKYDVVVVDDGALGDEELREIIFDLSAVKEAKKIIYTPGMDKDYFQKLTSFGIDGIVSSKAKLYILGEAIIKVNGGEKYYSKYVNEFVSAGRAKNNRLTKQLTQREKEILCLRNKGYKNKDIAEAFGISVKTVENHDENIKQKLELKSIKDLLGLKFFKQIPL